jgi:drug/metabolite transporter (DMT)-like permease
MAAIGKTQPVRESARTSQYFLLLVLACLMFAGQGTAIKFLNRQLGPVQITFLPFCTATILLIPLLIRARRNSQARQISWTDWRRFIIAGVGGQVVAQFGIVLGITRSLASNAAILTLLLPVISAVLAAIMLGERITRLRVVAFVIGLAGVLLLSAGSLRESSLLNLHYLTGNLFIVAGLCGSAFYNVYCKGLFARFQQLEVLVFSYIAASLAGLPLVVWAEPFGLDVFRGFGWQSWLSFGYQAIVTYGVAMLVFFRALKHLDVTVASLSLYMLPVDGNLRLASSSIPNSLVPEPDTRWRSTRRARVFPPYAPMTWRCCRLEPELP